MCSSLSAWLWWWPAFWRRSLSPTSCALVKNRRCLAGSKWWSWKSWAGWSVCHRSPAQRTWLCVPQLCKVWSKAERRKNDSGDRCLVSETNCLGLLVNRVCIKICHGIEAWQRSLRMTNTTAVEHKWMNLCFSISLARSLPSLSPSLSP